MSGFAPIHNHTHFSLLDGVSKPKQIAKRCVELGYNSVGMTDHGNVGCAVQFVSAMKSVCACGHQKSEHSDGGKCKNCSCSGYSKYPLKPVLGMEANISDNTSVKENDYYDLKHLPVVAKNLAGWKGLISASSYGYHKDHVQRESDGKNYPRIEKEKLAEFSNGNMIAISGHQWSELANSVFINPKAAYAQTNYDEVREFHVHPDWRNRMLRVVGEHIDLFGKENFFIGVEFSGTQHNPASLIAARAARYISEKHNIQRTATFNSHYPTKADAPDQRILLCAGMKTTLKDIQKRIQRGDESINHLKSNFMEGDFHIPSLEELQTCNDEEELVNSLRIADMCEDYDILHEPILPSYPCPDGLNADQYLTELCKGGWSAKVYNRVDSSKWSEYQERVRRELKVIKGAGLSSYFLIVQDYCNWARSKGMIVGPGRGSGAGSLVSYLVGITSVDPIKHGLSFERFYNAGRNAPGHISLPDIDCDFPVLRRKEIVLYLKEKFGHNMVANIATFNSIKGRGAVKTVFRAYDVPFDLVNRITTIIPKPERITEELQAMKDRGDEPSIVRYALETDPEGFREWVTMDDEGKCEGVYGSWFEQAMRLEGTKTNISTHAAGVVLASTPLADMCPLVYDEKLDGYIAGMEYPDLEAMGQVKLDVLGVAALDKVGSARDLLRYGYIDKEDAA